MVFVLAMIIFRGPSAMLIVSSGPMLGTVWALGLLKLFRVPYFGLAEVILPVMILMIGLTDGVHLVIHIRRSRAEGMDPRQATRSAVRHVGVGCALTSLTTAVAFASLMISDSREVSRFGFSSAVGVLITFWAVVLVVPLLSSTWLGRRIHLGHQRDLVGGAMRYLSVLPDIVVARARWVAVAGVMLTALLAGAALTLKPDYRLWRLPA
jgi:predicted RND superfamily exporter protein